MICHPHFPCRSFSLMHRKVTDVEIRFFAFPLAEEQANFRGRAYLGPIGAASFENEEYSDELGLHLPCLD